MKQNEFCGFSLRLRISKEIYKHSYISVNMDMSIFTNTYECVYPSLNIHKHMQTSANYRFLDFYEHSYKSIMKI